MASESPFIGESDFVGRGGIVPGGVGGRRPDDITIVSGELGGVTVRLLCGGESVFTREDPRGGSLKAKDGKACLIAKRGFVF